MDAYPCVRDPGSIELLLHLVKSSDPPPVADMAFLRAAGFRREGDTALVSLLQFLGLVADGKPTSTWLAMRGPDHGRILAEAVRRGYEPLFKRFDDPWDRDSGELQPLFGNGSGGSDMDLAFGVLTFKVLCDLAGESIRTAPAPVPAPRAPDPATIPAGPRVEVALDGRGVEVLRITVELDAEAVRRLVRG
jgi:hypothetical protein